MKVLVVGYCKTGTKTLNAALNLLGYKTYDYDHNFYYLGKEWAKIFTVGGTKEDFYRMYKDVDASCDTPAMLFWQEILEAFPDVKLVFMERESEEVWWKSVMKHGADHVQDRLTYGGESSLLFFRAFERINPTVAKLRYREHNATVLRNAPKDQLLVFKIKEGWRPLCEFLGKEIPDIPFPHKNQRADIIEVWFKESPAFLQMKKEFVVFLSIYVVVFAGFVYLVYSFM